MNRLNYFNPYNSKDGTHEDQLTRAYLVLLKHSSHAFFTFFEYCRTKQILSEGEQPLSILHLIDDEWNIETQKGNPLINTTKLLSVLISDSHIIAEKPKVGISERKARYDGIISFGNKLTIVIENKPRSENIWFDQLNPSKQNLSEHTQVYLNSSCLAWKEIIKHLNHLLTLPALTGYEKLMIDDFLSFVDDNFAYLNPFDNFGQCKNNKELLERRINNVLKSISIEENRVQYHRGWGWYINTPYSQIHKLGLILCHDEKNWDIELSLFFGDTQSQAQSFYLSNPDISGLNHTEWIIKPNFHVAFMESHLVWYESENKEAYLEFWKHNIELIKQQKRPAVAEYINSLISKNIISDSDLSKNELDALFYKTEKQTLNICPGFGLIYRFTSREAETLDKTGKFEKVVADKIREGLGIVSIEANDLLITK